MEKHLTATVYLVATINGEAKVLLHKHKTHDIWLGIGGHVEKDENPTEAAIREVNEEVGINGKLFSDKKDTIKTQYVTELIQPFIMLEEKISARPNEPAHYHVDCIYFAIIVNPQEVQMQEEFRWFSLEDLKTAGLEKEVAYNAEHALAQCKRLL